jgi:hypothetical protein
MEVPRFVGGGEGRSWLDTPDVGRVFVLGLLCWGVGL